MTRAIETNGLTRRFGDFWVWDGLNLQVDRGASFVAAVFYWLSLRGLGDLSQRPEKDILQVVSQEVE